MGPNAVVVVVYQPSAPVEPVIALDFAVGPVRGLAARCSAIVVMGDPYFAYSQFSGVDVESGAGWYPGRQHLQRWCFVASVQDLGFPAVIVAVPSYAVAASALVAVGKVAAAQSVQ